MTERELLELAAKAAGISGEWVENYGSGDYYYSGNCDGILHYPPGGCYVVWNPLTDDGDALRLAVKLQITIDFYEFGGLVICRGNPDPWIDERLFPGAFAATRRAIVRAAAEIGRKM